MLIGDTAAPPVRVRIIGPRGLPLVHLIVVREKLRRRRHGAVLKFGLRDRIQKTADVGDDRRLAGVEEIGNLRHRRMQAVVGGAAARSRRQRLQAGGQRKIAARLEVIGLILPAHRHDRIEAVVAAVHEKADQRLVVGKSRRALRRGRRADQTQTTERRVKPGAAERGTDAFAQEFATVHMHGRNLTSGSSIRANS
jgi:hypothetical protein